MQKQQGFTYLGVMFIVALIGLALSGAAGVWQVAQQREKERQMLWIGQQYIDAIASYYHASPGGNKRYPRTLDELLRDPRYPIIKRHLRKLWRDPLTGSSDWGLVRTSQGGIAGVYSHAQGQPFKQAGFGASEKWLAAKKSYQEWQFVYFSSSATEDLPQQGGEEPDSEPVEEESVEENDAAGEEGSDEEFTEEQKNGEA